MDLLIIQESGGDVERVLIIISENDIEMVKAQKFEVVAITRY